MPSSRPEVLRKGLRRPAALGPAGVLSLIRRPSRVPLVMGIVNVTPDSFYPRSRTPSVESAVEAALRQVEEGAAIVDIGGQSTRPGSDPVPLQEEILRVVPVVEALAPRVKAALSVDTDKAEVARLALEAGASLLNDVSALRNDPRMAEVARRFEAVILMHRGGESPRTMQENPHYADVVGEVRKFLEERIAAFVAAGGEASRALYDPGIGFGKNVDHNLSLVKRIGEFADLGPVVLGVSRKSFLGRIMAPKGPPLPGPEERLEGSLAVACWASLNRVSVLRVHDVRATVRALQALAHVRAA